MDDIHTMIDTLLEAEDIPGLVVELRCRDHPQHRMLALAALGRMDDSAVIPWLLKAALYDPDLALRAGAMNVLKDRLMGEMEMALRVEASGAPDEDPWLMDCHGEPSGTHPSPTLTDWLAQFNETDLTDEENPPDGIDLVGANVPTWQDTAAEEDELNGLFILAMGGSDLQMRLRAIRALGRFTQPGSNRALASLALYDVEPEVQVAAREVLEEKFGDDLPEFLESIQLELQLSGGVEFQLAEDEEDEPQDEPLQFPRAAQYPSAPVSAPQPSPVIQEERLPVLLWVAIGIAMMVLAVIVWLSVTR